MKIRKRSQMFSLISIYIAFGALPIMPQKLYADEKTENNPFFVQGSLRIREELQSWYGPIEAERNFPFTSVKAQLGVGAEDTNYKSLIQGQFSSIYDVPSGATGVGGVYRTVNGDDTSEEGVKLRQAFVTIRDDKAQHNALQVGRFLYTSGEEHLPENSNLKWLQSKRIAHRMIGPFDYTFGRSFDGARGDADFDFGSLTGFLSKPTEGGFLVNGNRTIDDVMIGALSYTKTLSHSSNQVFSYTYHDDRNALKPDNRLLATRQADTEDIDIVTFGASSVHYYEIDNLGVDAVAWGVGQTGSWGNLMQQSYAFVTEAGLHFNDLKGKPALRLGYTRGSGDTDSEDSRHQTFFQMEPTARAYALTPFYNMQNNSDVYLQGVITPMQNFTIKSELHKLRLSNSEDLLYSGGGAGESNTRFGYSGFAMQGASNIGTLLDIELAYQINPSVGVSLYYGHLFGNDGIGDALPSGSDDSIDYGLIEVNLKL